MAAPTTASFVRVQGQNSLVAAPAAAAAGHGSTAVIVNRPAAAAMQAQVAAGAVRSPAVLASGHQGVLRVAGPGHGQPTAVQAPTSRSLTAAQVGRNIVINHPGMRPGAPGSQIMVPLHTLQGLQPGQGIPTGQPGTLLVKTETGHYQILKVGNSVPSSTAAAASTASGTVSSAVLPTQPVVQSPSVRPIQRQVITRPVVSTAPAPAVAAPMTAGVRPAGAAAAAAASAMPASGGTVSVSPESAKQKCKSFISTLLSLAHGNKQVVAANVSTLIQDLIDGAVDPDTFTTKLRRELKSSNQPALAPFLKKSLPYLQEALRTGEVTIEGVRPPRSGPTAAAAMPPSLPTPAAAVTRLRPPQMVAQAPPGVLRQAGIVTAAQPNPAAVLAQQRQAAPLARPPNSVLPLPTQPVMAASAPPQQSPAIPRPTVIPTPKMPQPSATSVATMQLLSQQQPMPRLPTAISSPAPTASVAAVGKKASASSGPPSAVASSSGASSSAPPPSSAFSAAGDEDINDVAAMGGVNLVEESQRMQGATDLIGSQIRSCKDETFLQTGQLRSRISKICRDRGLEEPSADVIAMVSHATQDRLKTLLEKLAVISEHRMDVIRLEGDAYQVTQDVKGQLKFLAELDKLERRRHEEAERDMLLRAAKSRTKTEDPEKEKLKARAKELQRHEEEMQRHEKANNTALMAIGGPKKKLRLDGDFAAAAAASAGGLSALATGGPTMRPRTKRVHMRDLVFLMEQEKGLKRSSLLWKAHVS